MVLEACGVDHEQWSFVVTLLVDISHIPILADISHIPILL
jgi:hypothetical protein